MNEILDIKEASAFTGLSEGTLRRKANNGTIQAIRKGTRYFFTKEELKKLLPPIALTVIEETKSPQAVNPDESLLDTMVSVPLRKLFEWGKVPLPGSEVHKDRPFLSKPKTVMTS